MRELDRRIATLRLRLAEIDSRREQIKALEQQYRRQMDKVADFAIYESGDLDTVLSIADDVDGRLAENGRTLRHLDMIRARCQEELEALQLTRGIDVARSELTELEARRQEVATEMRRLEQVEPSHPDAGDGNHERLAQLRAQIAHIDAEIKRLRNTIAEASERAARTVSSRVRQ